MDAFNSFLSKIEDQILTPIIAVLTLAALLIFVFGIVNFIRNAADAEKRKEGKMQMITGIIGLAIMFGATAIVSFIKHQIVGA